jgi:hypothetical protein
MNNKRKMKKKKKEIKAKIKKLKKKKKKAYGRRFYCGNDYVYCLFFFSLCLLLSSPP